MTRKILFLTVLAAGLLAAQDAAPKEGENSKTGDLNVTAPARKCSIPLINLRPGPSSRMPVMKPPSEFAPRRFFIEPPAPPCEDEDRNPVLSNAAPRREDQSPQAK